MCTRFYVEADADEIRDIVSDVQSSQLSDKFNHAGYAVLTSGEIRPTNVVPVIAPGKNGMRAAFPMRWGFQIPNRSLVVNARAETAAERPTFKEAWEKHRCIIPASWYFEWEHLIGNASQKKTGDKYMIQPKGSEITWLAGLYRIEEMSGIQVPVFTVLTREPSEEIRFIHDRMPVILQGEAVEKWIKPDSKPDEIIKDAMTDMVFEKIIA